MSKRDYYEVLGVDKSADPSVIKKAYRKLAMKYHPDKNPDDSAAEDRFKEAAEAYEVLGNAEKKAKYDQFGHAGFQGMGGGPGGFADASDIFNNFSDIFGDFFGGAAGGGGFGGQTRGGRSQKPRPKRGSDLRYFMEVSLKDSYEGTKQEIAFKSDEDCQTCDGSGAEPGKSAQTCDHCGGSGQVIQRQGFFTMATTCPSCRGAGTVIKHPCKKCSGNGRLERPRKIQVTVPAGVESGSQLRLSGEGDGGFLGGGDGDLYVVVKVKDHPKYHREGLDLVSELEVSYLQSILGTEVEVETLNSKVNVEVPDGSQSGDEVLVKKSGFPSLRGRSRGDIRYKLKVKIPKSLTKNEEKLLREIAEEKGESVSKSKGWFG